MGEINWSEHVGSIRNAEMQAIERQREKERLVAENRQEVLSGMDRAGQEFLAQAQAQGYPGVTPHYIRHQTYVNRGLFRTGRYEYTDELIGQSYSWLSPQGPVGVVPLSVSINIDGTWCYEEDFDNGGDYRHYLYCIKDANAITTTVRRYDGARWQYEGQLDPLMPEKFIRVLAQIAVDNNIAL